MILRVCGDILGRFCPFLKQQVSLKAPFSQEILPAVIYALVLPRSMKKTPPRAPAEAKVNPVPEKPEKPESVQELKPPEVGTLGCHIAPGPSQHSSVAVLVVLGHQAVLWALERLQPV